MKLSLKALVATLLAVCIAVPGFGGVGGENAGGTGVWILPRSAFLANSSVGVSSQYAGQSFTVGNFAQDVELVVSAECGRVAAFVVDAASGVQIPLSANGRSVLLGKEELRAFGSAQASSLEIVIVDDLQQGYCIEMQILPDGASAVMTLR